MKRFTTTATMLLVTVVLGVSGLGFLEVADDPGSAFTFLHIPVILAAILDGPLAGSLVGLVFGAVCLLHYDPTDPVVQLLPRLLIGPVTAGTFALVRELRAHSSARNSLAALVAVMAGSWTNTLGVCLVAIMRGHNTLEELAPMALLHGSAEWITAEMVAFPIVVLIYNQRRRKRR
jgi:uncharacterized membrane protein